MWIKKVPSTGKIRYCERYTDHLTGKKKDVSVTFDKDTARNRKEAVLLLQKMIDSRQSPQKESITLSRLVEEFLKDKQLSIRPSSYKCYHYSLNSILRIFDPDIIVDTLTARYVQNKLLKTALPPDVLNTHLKYFKALIRWGYKSELVESVDFINRLNNFADNEPKSKNTLKFLEADELKQVLEYMDNPVWENLTAFLALSGLRIGEAIALTNDDIDFDAHVIHVNKTFSITTNTVGHAKTNSSVDDVFIQPELEAVIRNAQKHAKQMQMRYGFRSSLLFNSIHGNHIQYFTFNNYFKRATLAVVGRSLTTHSLRHTHASLLFEQGFSLDEVSRRLRHGDSKVTKDVYIHVTNKLKERDAQKLSSVYLL